MKHSSTRFFFAQHRIVWPTLCVVAAGGLRMVFAMWWLYFARPAHTLLAGTGPPDRGFLRAYGHYLIFASAAAVGAGLAVIADQVTHRIDVFPQAAGAMVAVPAAVFLVTVWALHLRSRASSSRRSSPSLPSSSF